MENKPKFNNRKYLIQQTSEDLGTRSYPKRDLSILI
jgi:hypothetical protein